MFEIIAEKLKSAEKILLISHSHPDGDACGSLLALAAYLEKQYKSPSLFLADGMPTSFEFLPNSGKVTDDKTVLNKEWDVVVFLDTGDKNRAGICLEELKTKCIVNIDHHWKNPRYGTINIIDDAASSTCEIVYDFFSAIGFEVDREIATCLLNGILTDTGGFCNAATTHKSIDIASDLIRHGAKLYRIHEYLFRNKTMSGLKLWGLAFSRLRINSRWNLAYTYIHKNDLELHGVSEEEADGLTNFLSILSDVSMIVVFRITDTETRVSLRTKTDHIDLSRFAGLFGGGGHQKSSGFTVPWPIHEREGQLIIE